MLYASKFCEKRTLRSVENLNFLPKLARWPTIKKIYIWNCDVNLVQCSLEWMAYGRHSVIASTGININPQHGSTPSLGGSLDSLWNSNVCMCCWCRNQTAEYGLGVWGLGDSGLAKCLAMSGPSWSHLCLTLNISQHLKNFFWVKVTKVTKVRLSSFMFPSQKIWSIWDLETQLPSLACDCHLPFSWGLSSNRGTPCCKGAAWESQNAYARFCLRLTTFQLQIFCSKREILNRLNNK